MVPLHFVGLHCVSGRSVNFTEICLEEETNKLFVMHRICLGAMDSSSLVTSNEYLNTQPHTFDFQGSRGSNTVLAP